MTTNVSLNKIPLLILHPFNDLFSRTTWVSWHQEGKISLDLNEARDDKVWGCSGIRWTMCRQSAPYSRQITTPTPHHSIFTGCMLFLMPKQQCQSTDGILKNTSTKYIHQTVSATEVSLLPVLVCEMLIH